MFRHPPLNDGEIRFTWHQRGSDGFFFSTIALQQQHVSDIQSQTVTLQWWFLKDEGHG